MDAPAQLLALYRPGLSAAAVVAFLFMFQTVVGLFLRVRHKQPGGMPLAADHGSFLYRADRARSNTFEVLGVFSLLLVLTTSLRSNPLLVNTGAVVFCLARLGHMAAYYANRPRARTLAFLIGNIGLIAMLISVMRALTGF